MCARRVFSNNNDSTYNNYKKIKKISSLNIWLKNECDDSPNKLCNESDNYKSPITIINGMNSFYINDNSNTVCNDIINSDDLYDCKKNILYPHGIFFNKSYPCKEEVIDMIKNNNLSSKISFNTYYEPFELKQLKIQIMNNLLIPLTANKWDYLVENSFMTDIMLRRINNYYNKYKIDDLLIYSEFIKAYEIIISEHIQLENIEKKMYQNLGTAFVFKTNKIKLKPEYEIYNLIYGKPLHIDTYNKEILLKIQSLIQIDDINFDKIKAIILNIFH